MVSLMIRTGLDRISKPAILCSDLLDKFIKSIGLKLFGVRMGNSQYSASNRGIPEDLSNAALCGEVFKEVVILSTGDVVCSCIDPMGESPLGSIYQQRINEIFYGVKYNELRKQILASDATTYCPALKRDCCFKIKTSKQMLKRPIIEKLTIETTSFCNLRCPECRVPYWMREKSQRLSRLDIVKVKEAIIDTKDTLKKLCLFNWGEPFLDENLLDILRFARQSIPQLIIYIDTNGTIIPQGWAEIIVREGLLDEIFFSIDGTCQESYEIYRVGGDFERAFNNMISLQKYKSKYGKSKPHVIWQYILFEWNTSDEEIKRVQNLAKKYQLTILWVATSSRGASKKYIPGYEAFDRLEGVKTIR